MHADILHPPLPTERGKKYIWRNLPGASVSFALNNALLEAKGPLILIAADTQTATRLVDEIQFFNQEKYRILFFPDWETLPYDHFSPHQDIISDRLSVLSLLPSLTTGLVVTTINTIMYRLPPKPYIDSYSFLFKVADQLNIDILRTRLSNSGYRNVSQVREHGEFAIRGSIIDIFPMGSETPYRIDLFDNEIDSIRIFSAETQRTLEKINEIKLLPAKEFPITDEAIEQFRVAWRNQFSGNPLKSPIYQDVSEGIYSAGIEYYLPLFFTETATLFDYLPENASMITIDNIDKQGEEFWSEIHLRYEQARHDISRPLLPPSQIFISMNEVTSACKAYPQIQIENKQITESKTSNQYHFEIHEAPTLDINHKSAKPLAPLQEFMMNHDGRILFCAESTGRREVLLQLFNSIHLTPTYCATWHDFFASDITQGIVVAPLDEGFQLSQPKLTVIAESQLYGKRVMQRRLRKQSSLDPDAIIRDLTELRIDDPVVHINHGVGRYRGLQTLSVGNEVNEFLCLEYQDKDKLYVPVSSLHLISRYTGTEAEHAPIHKLGGDHWARAKRKAADRVRDVAAELLDLYAKRAGKPGEAFQIPEQYAAFASAFPFEETPDQLHAIEQVFSDMTSEKPMDRVICGDVGFGKTEVAMRAAFLAISNNKQVIILVPTTLLAQQHLQNFQDRFADWPIMIEMLSRFKTAKQQKEILNRMENGQVDLVIGTHKLLQENIKLKRLGLVIIDEEHRFGVKQKEKLKALRSQVDMLTLTATPIPRTLNMALSGIRDLSVIATPPSKRLSVKTFIHQYSNSIIQEAILREIMRGGQVYFLYNDVSTINKKVDEIKTIVPEARVAVAHGQMHERDLERIMSQFYHRHYNVLICSTIIESGIDIPTANTIIINRADKFGIAQLHQLRGRVGRSHHQAYAYLLTPPPDLITNDAKKRLDAVSQYDDLGIGFTLATHDLEIRGAGELLGEEQSGNMHEVGFSLYMDLLSRAVDELKIGKEPDFDRTIIHPGGEVDLRIPALIPENYLYDVELRLQFYKRIANAKDETKLDDIHVEMIDRFGLTPTPLKNLFAVSLLKLKANALGILKIEANEKGGKIEFDEKPNINPETLIRLIQEEPQNFRLDGPLKLRFTLPEHDKNERISLVNAVLNRLSGGAA